MDFSYAKKNWAWSLMCIFGLYPNGDRAQSSIKAITDIPSKKKKNVATFLLLWNVKHLKLSLHIVIEVMTRWNALTDS